MQISIQKLLSTLIPIIAGIAMIAIGIYMLVDPHSYYIETTATVTSVESFYQGDDLTYRVYGEYTVDGKTYENVNLGSFSTIYVEGEEITIRYNPDKPEKIDMGNSKLSAIIFIVVGAGAILFAFIRGLRR